MSISFQKSSGVLVHQNCEPSNGMFLSARTISPVRKRSRGGVWPAEYVCKGCGAVWVQYAPGASLEKESKQ